MNRDGTPFDQEHLAEERLTWMLNPRIPLLTIECRGGVTDNDLIERIPAIWQQHEDIHRYDVLVDLRQLTNEGGWTWAGLKKLSCEWNAYAKGKPINKRIAILTGDKLIVLLVKLLAHLFEGGRYRCFTDTGPALDWIASK